MKLGPDSDRSRPRKIQLFNGTKIAAIRSIFVEVQHNQFFEIGTHVKDTYATVLEAKSKKMYTKYLGREDVVAIVNRPEREWADRR